MKTKSELNPELNLDVDLIVERLQSDGIFECDRIPQHQVKQALTKWLNRITDSINDNPDWWIKQFESKAFKDSINQFLDDYSQDIELDSELNSENEKEFAVLCSTNS